MSDKTKLSERVRPDCEAAPWVINELKELEACLAFERVTVAELKADLRRARSVLTVIDEKFRDDSHLRRFPVIWGMVDQVLGREEKKQQS